MSNSTLQEPLRKTVLFHVGLPKAASTFLQKRVFPSARNATFLNLTSANIGHLPLIRSSSNAFLNDPERARQAIREAQEMKVIVSAEGFVGDPYRSFRDQILNAKSLKEIWPDAAILLVVRRQDEFCQSLFGQALRHGYPYSPVRYLRLAAEPLKSETASRHFDYRVIDLDRIVTTFADLFGGSRVFVLPLELLATDRTAFVQEISRIGEFSLPDIEDFPSENSAYSLWGYLAARLLNKLCFDEYESGRRLFLWLDRKATSGGLWLLVLRVARMGTRRLRRLVRLSVDLIGAKGRSGARPLNESELALIRAHFSESNRRLSERMGLDLERYGYF